MSCKKEVFKKIGLFKRVRIDELWRKEWQDMPEFIQEDVGPYHSITINFKDKSSLIKFLRLIDQKITEKTKFIWYPKIKITSIMGKRYINKS